MGDYRHVHQTFEELAGQHIDGLYHGARFLHGGEETSARDLVLWTMTGAFQEFRRINKESALEQWLERKLVEAFLARTGWADPSTADRSTADRSTADRSTEDSSTADLSIEVPSSQEPSSGAVEIDPEALFRAAAKLAPVARAAIWLVLFRRWRYEEACTVLKTDLAGLKGLLRGRHVLLTAVAWRSADRNGTDHDRGH